MTYSTIKTEMDKFLDHIMVECRKNKMPFLLITGKKDEFSNQYVFGYDYEVKDGFGYLVEMFRGITNDKMLRSAMEIALDFYNAEREGKHG